MLSVYLVGQRHNATVTIVHEHTPNPAEATKKADIVVSATGVAQLVRGHWLKNGAVVLDVGTSAVEVFPFPINMIPHHNSALASFNMGYFDNLRICVPC